MGAHLLAQRLIGDDDDVGGVPHSCGCPSDVGEDDFCNQDVSGVQVQHLTQPGGEQSKMSKTHETETLQL